MTFMPVEDAKPPSKTKEAQAEYMRKYRAKEKREKAKAEPKRPTEGGFEGTDLEGNEHYHILPCDGNLCRNTQKRKECDPLGLYVDHRSTGMWPTKESLAECLRLEFPDVMDAIETEYCKTRPKPASLSLDFVTPPDTTASVWSWLEAVRDLKRDECLRIVGNILRDCYPEIKGKIAGI